jgi:hypothetical protein
MNDSREAPLSVRLCRKNHHHPGPKDTFQQAFREMLTIVERSSSSSESASAWASALLALRE